MWEGRGVVVNDKELFCSNPAAPTVIPPAGATKPMTPSEKNSGKTPTLSFLNRPPGLPPADALNLLERSVLEYHGNAALEDDFTLLFARIC